MGTRDPRQERERLEAAYGQLPEGRIEQLAHEAWELTDVGREVLRAEIARRGLSLVLADAPEDPKYSERVTIRRYRDVPEALVAQSVLKSAEIDCFLADDIVIRLDWYWSNALGGVRVRVPEEDASASIEILSSSRNPVESFRVDGVGEFTQPRCPQCNSLDVSLGELTSFYKYLTIALCAFGGLTFVFPLRRPGWTCNACVHRWSPEDAAPPDLVATQ